MSAWIGDDPNPEYSRLDRLDSLGDPLPTVALELPDTDPHGYFQLGNRAVAVAAMVFLFAAGILVGLWFGSHS